MPALGIGLVWLAYTAGLYGWILMKGYNVSLKELMSPNWPPTSRFSTDEINQQAGK